MVLAAIVFCCATVLTGSAATPAGQIALIAISEKAAAPAATPEASRPALPETPAPKAISASNSNADNASLESSESITPGGQPISNAPLRPAIQGTYESARQRKIWYGLVAASSGAAAFDAWSTRRAVSGGYGVEGDPLLRPFAHSNAIYAATQVSPAIMDYLGHRMMTSHHEWMRRIWWVPQVAGSSFSLGAGIHNCRMVP